MFIPTKELPAILQQALADIGFHKKDISVKATDVYILGGPSYADYTRRVVVILNLATGERKTLHGSWGGAGYSPNPVDTDETRRSIPPNVVVIEAEEGGNFPVRASILTAPGTLTPLLSEATPLDETLKRILHVISGYTSQGRQDEFESRGWGKYGPGNPYIQKLAAMGLVKIMGSGVKVTTAGKNVLTQ